MISTKTAPEIPTRAVDPTTFHYFKKTAITRSLVLGTQETALCGYSEVIGVPAGERTGGRASRTVCPLCQSLYSMLGGPK